MTGKGELIMNNKNLLEPIRVEIDPEDYTDQYEEMLDEIYGDVDIAGYTYGTSYALKELDLTAYRCGLLDYVDSLGLEEGYECPLCGEVYEDFDGALCCCQDEDEDEEE